MGSIQTNLGYLLDLEDLVLTSNKLGEDLYFSTSLRNCSKMELLSIELNHFKGVLPNSIANLSTK